MNLLRNALLGAAGLVVVALPAYAANSTTVADQSAVKATRQQLAQRPYDPSAGSVGFRNENPGGVGFKKSKKKKKAKK
jgi:hypothetical protein